MRPGKPRGRSRNVERRLQRGVTRPSQAKGSPMSKPTIVLVHGAFGDASSWRAVFERLDGDEHTILPAALPLRGVASDASYLGAVIEQPEAPVVLLGPSSAGCVITVPVASGQAAGSQYVA